MACKFKRQSITSEVASHAWDEGRVVRLTFLIIDDSGFCVNWNQYCTVYVQGTGVHFY